MRNNHDDPKVNAPVNSSLTPAEQARTLELYLQRRAAEKFLIDHNLDAFLKLAPKLRGL